MGQSSFGLNYKTTFVDTGTLSLPAGLLQRGTNNDGEFIFVQANGAIDQYAAVGVTGAGQAAMLTTTTYAASTVIGFAQVAVADNEYFWLWVGSGGGTGRGIYGKVAASYVAYAAINTTAVAGVVDDAATKVLGGVNGLTTDGGSGSSVELMASGSIVKVTA
jgi:hypothetical protein